MATKLDKVEVVTVGVGWAGGIVAAELSKAGHQVVGLEKGGANETIDYTNKHDTLRYDRRLEIMEHLSDSTVTFRNSIDQTANPVRDKKTSHTGEGEGGGGSHWAAQTHRYFPYDFEIHSQTVEKYGEERLPENSTLQDWGVTYDEIEPYYDKFEKTMGISGEESEYDPPRVNPFPNRPHKRTKEMSLFKEAAEKLGHHPFVNPSGNISEQYENPDGQTLNACQYNGFCMNSICEYGARATPLTTVIPTAKATGNFELRTDCRVTRVLHDDGKATGVLYIDLNSGEEFEQPADLVVLTSYTFNNSKLLLLSEIGQPYDPETGEGVIGKNFTDHHTMPGATGFFENNKFNRYIGAGALNMIVGDFNADNFDHTEYDFIHGGQMQQSQNGSAPINSLAVPRDTPTWGKDFKKNSIHYFYRNIGIATQMVTIPYKENYLDLDPTYKDKYGDPLIRVTFDYGENERKLSDFFVEKTSEMLEEMGADIVQGNPIPEHFTPGFAFQHNGGGVIMGEDPETSAVNNYLQMWDMENLFVCGASAFPHFGATNPTLTLGALTYRATEGMMEYLDGDGGLLVDAPKKSTFA